MLVVAANFLLILPTSVKREFLTCIICLFGRQTILIHLQLAQTIERCYLLAWKSEGQKDLSVSNTPTKVLVAQGLVPSFCCFPWAQS